MWGCPLLSPVTWSPSPAEVSCKVPIRNKNNYFSERRVQKGAVKRARDTCEVVLSFPSPGGTKAQHPTLPQHQQPSINCSRKKRTDVTKIVPGSIADHSQSTRVWMRWAGMAREVTTGFHLGGIILTLNSSIYGQAIPQATLTWLNRAIMTVSVGKHPAKYAN